MPTPGNISQNLQALAITCEHRKGNINIDQRQTPLEKRSEFQASNISQCKAVSSWQHWSWTAASVVAYEYRSIDVKRRSRLACAHYSPVIRIGFPTSTLVSTQLQANVRCKMPSSAVACKLHSRLQAGLLKSAKACAYCSIVIVGGHPGSPLSCKL